MTHTYRTHQRLIASFLAALLFSPPAIRLARADDKKPALLAPSLGDKEPEAAPAPAAGTPAPAPASEEPAMAEPLVRTTTFLLSHPGVPDDKAVPVMRTLEEGLKRNKRLEMKDLDTRLADFAQEVPSDQIEQGRQAFKDGMKAMNDFDLPKAIKKLTEAVEVLAKVMPHIKKQELAEAMIALAAAHLQLGDRKSARTQLSKLFVWRPDFQLDTNKFPPMMINPVEEARKEAEKAKRGSLEIKTEPVPAQAYVDGKYVGVTPTFADGLIVGEHFVTIKREGYRKAVSPAQVSAKNQQTVTISLERSRKYLLVEQALAALEKTVGSDVIDKASDDLKEVLFIDHAVFVRLKPGMAGVEMDICLYDLRTHKRLSRIQKPVPTGGPKALAGLATAVYTNVNYEGELEAPKDAPPPKAIVRRAFYKTWWFWTVVGLVVGGAIVGGVLAPKAKECGAGNFCPEIRF